MKSFLVICIVLCSLIWKFSNAKSSEEVTDVQETCCTHGESFAMTSSSIEACSGAAAPDEIEPEDIDACIKALHKCCDSQFKRKDECTSGIKMSPEKRCSVPKSDIAKTCCEECIFGTLTGASQGKEACGESADEYISPTTALRKNAYYQCCVEAADKPEPTTEKKLETTTEKKKEVPKQKCKTDSCEHICSDELGVITCQCREGFRLQSDKKHCKDINECAEAVDDLCPKEGTVCHNLPGSFKCVPIKKRELGTTCPPGFKKNVQNQVCDDINECQLPRPPCPKYLCENTIGGYKCAGKPGKPISENTSGTTTEGVSTPATKNDICPQGFRAGPDDECLDIDECEETSDDCQRLSQHCINTHGSFFCQDHVSKRCAPGFKVNSATGVCEDINECEESMEICKRNEICINLPGAYNCKSKISTLPKLATKTCQEGTRPKPGGSICEDIDECREGTHLCDQFQNCINTFGGHECRCKNGFELDSTSGACADIDECALKLDNCSPGTHCLNVLGTFTCTRRLPTPSTTTTTTTAPPVYEYEYYDSEEENPTSTTSTTTPRPTTTKPKPRSSLTTTTTTTTTTRVTTTSKPTTTTFRATTTTPTATTTSPRLTTTSKTTTPYNRPRPQYNPFPTRLTPTTSSTPLTNRPSRTRRPEITVPSPIDTVIDNERNPDSNVIDKPEDKRYNGGDKDSEGPFDPNQLHCLNGYERNSYGECVDRNECDGTHTCSNLEVCRNKPGGYICECMAGFHRDTSGWCAVSVTPTTTLTTSTTQRVSTVSSSPNWVYSPARPNGRPYIPPTSCELGYTYSSQYGKCVDIDECELNKATCSPEEDCVNSEGGYQCVCGKRCRIDNERPAHILPSNLPRGDSSVITVGAQYGQRGPRYLRPSYTRLPNSGAIVTTCPWGYKLHQDAQCVDINECSRNISQCGPQQRCENFFGGYSCQCPAGHRLVGQNKCEDIDECAFGVPCSYNSKCLNTVGSYRCVCAEGFRNAPTNDKVCVDVDECADGTALCSQRCANAWGGFRCYCEPGYRLHSDNRTCMDVDECAEWAALRLRGRICGGQCINTRGSFRCACPAGYHLADDGRACIDIDECETGEANCANAGDPALVCQNTRGGYHCHRINCPSGYRLEGKHRCSRIQRSCSLSDWTCIQQPSSYSYNFITFVSNIFLPSGRVDLFTMHGPSWSDSVVSFEMRLVDVQAAAGVKPASLHCFDMRPSNNICVISLICSLAGPQVVELELTMSLVQRGQFAGSAVARLVVIVSQYEF